MIPLISSSNIVVQTWHLQSSPIIKQVHIPYACCRTSMLVIMTGDNATYEEGGDSYVYIFNGSVTITDDDHPTYVTPC